MVWLLVYGLAAFALGWRYLAIGSRTLPTPTADRLLLGLPVGLLLASIVSFVANSALGVRFTRPTILAVAAGLVLIAFLLVRARVPAAPAHGAIRSLDRTRLLILAAAGLVVAGFLVWMCVLLLRRPLAGYDFYLYHWHYARHVFETGWLPADASPSDAQRQYAFPPLSFLLYGVVSHLLGHLSQLGPRLIPIFFAVGTVLVSARLASVVLKLSLPAALTAGAFTLWSGFHAWRGLQENTEMPNAFFTLAAAYWLLRRDLGPWSRAAGGGALLAGAYWSRYNGLAAFGILAVVLVGGALWERRTDRRWRELAVAAGGLAVGLLLIAPHLAHNLLLWGNPLYPMFAPWLGGYLIDPWVIQESLSGTTPQPFFGLAPDWFLHPFQYFPLTGGALAFLLAALPLAIARLRQRDVAAAQLLLAAGLYFACYVVFMRAPNEGEPERHLLPVVALAGPLAGLVFEEVTRRSRTAIWSASALTAGLAWYVVGRHALFHENLVLGLMVLAVFLATRSRRLARRPPSSLRLELLPLFLLPFLVMGLWTARAPDSTAGYVVVDGLLQLPEAAFMRGVADQGKYLTFERRRELLAGEPLPADHPLLERFYRERLDGDDGLRALRALGVRYVYWSSREVHPLMGKSPLFSRLDDGGLFRRVYYASDQVASVAIYELK
jgi:hypothetical protein